MWKIQTGNWNWKRKGNTNDDPIELATSALEQLLYRKVTGELHVNSKDGEKTWSEIENPAAHAGIGLAFLATHSEMCKGEEVIILASLVAANAGAHRLCLELEKMERSSK